jgi:hypothetical protein
MRRLLVTAALFLLHQTSAGAQTVRGVVLDVADKPVAGVVVLLIDAASHEAARTLSNEKGEFRLVAPIAGTYRVRTLRIGYRPVTSDRIDVTGEDETPRRFMLSNVPFALDTIRTNGRNACRVVARDSAATTFALWEQVRTALTATQLTASGRTILTTTEAYDRTLDPSFKRIRQQSTSFRTDFVKQPWRSLAADSLRHAGYVTTEQNNFRIYNAPGLDALLSSTFLEDHCLRLEPLSDSKRVGITFEPTSDRKDFAEIRGTLSLDRATSELRSMSFQYVNVSREEQDNAGGDMEFVRMRNGMWAISRWNIRMPTIVLVPMYNVVKNGFQEVGKDIRVDSIKVTGGEVVVAMISTSRGRDTIWSRPRLVLAGTVLDSLTGHPVDAAKVSVSGTTMSAATDAAGRFSIPDVLPGQYILEVRTPSLDSVNTVNQTSLTFTDSAGAVTVRVPTAAQIASSVCGTDHVIDARSKVGILLGTVDVPGDTTPPKGVHVMVEWREIRITTPSVYNEPKLSDVRTDARGTFRVCGVPLNTVLSVHGTTDSASTSYVSVKLTEGQRFARANLSLDQHVVAGGVLVGVVLTDTTNQPIADAVVSLPDITMSTRTDSGGAFRLAGIPPGSQHVVVRRIGYGGLDTHIDFGTNAVVNRQIVLNRVTVLDSVVTTAAHRDVEMDDFATNKAMGLGHFWTRADLAKMEGALLESFLRQTPGLTIVRGAHNQDWIGNATPPRSTCAGLTPASLQSGAVIQCLIRERLYYVPTADEMNMGASVACLARVYLDGQLLNSGDPAQPVDLRQFPPSQIEAVEYYARPDVTPEKYMRMKNPQCGVLVIHIRRP